MTNDLKAAREALLACLEQERRTPPVPIKRHIGEGRSAEAAGHSMDLLGLFAQIGNSDNEYVTDAASIAPAASVGFRDD